MTREEAIKYLIEPVATSTEPSEEYRKQKEAYNMAIEALKHLENIEAYMHDFDVTEEEAIKALECKILPKQ